MAIPGDAPRDALDAGKDLDETLSARAAARLRALDAMLGGVAHDLNNALSVVLMNLDIMQQDAAVTSKHARRIDGMLDAMTGASALVRHLLNFSHSSRPEPEVISSAETLPPLIELIEVAVGKEIEIELDTGDIGPGCVFVDPASFEVAIVHGAMQIASAMRGGGVLKIKLGQNEAAGERDDEVVLTLEGVPRDSSFAGDKAKPLDLAIVEQFARDAQGRVSVENADDRHRIVLYIPACPETTTV